MIITHIARNWSIPKSLALIAGLFLLPSVVQLGVYVQSRVEAIHSTEAEIEGAKMGRHVWSYISGLGNDKAPDIAMELRTALGQKPNWPDAQQALAALQAATTTIERLNRAVSLLAELSEHSGLILDPNADTYYLQLAFMDGLGDLRLAIGHLTAVRTESLTNSEVAANFARASDGFERLKAISSNFVKNDATGIGNREFAPKITEIEQLWNRLSAGMTNSNYTWEGLPSTFKSDASKLDELTSATAILGSDIFAPLAQNRNSATLSNILWTSGFLAVLTILSGLLAYRISGAMTSRLGGLISVMDAIAKKDASVAVPHLTDTNEYGSIARALEKFREGVFENVNLTNSAVKNAESQKAESDYYAQQHDIFMTAFEGAANRMAQGDFSHRIVEKVIAEYEPIIEQMNLMMGRLQTAQREKIEAESNINTAVAALAEALSELAGGNLEASIHQDVATEFNKLKSDFNAAAKELQSTIQLVKQGAENIKLGTDEISEASNDLSRRTENQAASLEETAAAVKEITQTVNKTAKSATHARDTVSAAKVDAEKSGEIVRKAIDAMNAIENSSKQISQIIGVIDEIAFQTNLLALNAGVEAARAGDAGRGFAVVASEVRALAQRSADAAKEIKGLISASTTQVAQGVQLVGETGKSLTRIVEQVGNINAIVVEIASTANEQALGLGQVNTAIGEMDQVTQQNAAMVEQATAATQALSRQTEDMARLVSKFRIGESSGHDLKPRRETAKAPAKVNGRPAHKTKAANGSNGAHSFAAKVPAHDTVWEDF